MALFGGRKPPKAIIAAATRLRIGERSTPKPKPQDWQRRAWDFYDSVGEVEDAHRQFAGLVSRVRFFPAFQTSPDAPPSSLRDVLEGDDTPPGLTESYVDFVEELHRRITSPQGGPSAIQREMTTQLSVPGESFLIGREVEGGDEQFDVVSGDELVYRGQRQWELRPDPGVRKGEPLDPDTTLIIRVWQQHPRFSAVATSPMRAILDDLDELLLLAQGNRAVAQSRIANAGILYLSKDIGFGPGDPTKESEGHDSEQDPFFARLAESMLTAIKDPGSAAAVVPIVVRADGVAEGKIEHVTLDRPLDDTVLARMDALAKRIAYGLPLPLEAIMGLSDLNHWNAWLVSEQTFNVYVEPMVLLIADALTCGWLRPGLVAANFPPELVRRTLVWYDPSAIVTHPNRAEDFRQGHAAFVISGDSYRREIGATDEDAPDADEIDQRIQIANATRSRDGVGTPPASPETVTPGPASPAAIGPATPTRLAERPALTAATPAAETPRQRALAALGPRLAEIDRALLERLLERSDRAVSDAVRQAGARLRSRAQTNTEARRMLRGVPAEQVAATLGPGMIARLQLDQEQLLAGTLDPVQATFDSQVGRAQRAALDALEPLDAETRERIEAEQDDDRNEGWLLLLAGLSVLASERMFNPAQEIPELGEFDDSIDVPASLVRRALARAGGAQGIEATAAGGLLTAGGVRPVGGVATGPVIERIAKESLQAVFAGWEWLYGDPSTRKQPYAPHRALNHATFTSWQDPILANTAGVWPGVSFFHPGDHFWCRCSFEPIVGDDDTVDEGTVRPPSDEPLNTED